MKFSFAWAAAAAGMLPLLLTASALAQGTGPTRAIAPVAQRPSGTNVAVIDISLVFEHYPAFQTKMQALKAEVEEFEAFLKGEQGKMLKMRDDLQGYTPGSDDYKKKEEEMARVQSEIQIKMARQRREFLEKEARIYFDAYNEAYNVVAALADRNEIKLVLRFNSESMKPDDRASVLQGVNRAVVFQRNLNITNLVIRELGGTVPAPGAKPAPSVGDNGVSNRTFPKDTRRE